MKHLAVINPHSFLTPESMQTVKADLEACFGAVGEEYKIHISRYPRDAIAVVHRYINSVPKNETVRVYAVGGDGILFECLNGMVDFSNAELTNIPYGNAYDFVRAFGEDAPPFFRNIKEVIHAPARPVDIINCGSNYALIEANIGIIGQTIIQANATFPRIPKKWLRKNIGLMYSLCGARAILKKDILAQEYTVIADDKEIRGQFSNIRISNIPCDGGTLTPSPYAKPDDGLLDIIFTKSCSAIKAIMIIGDMNNGRFEKHELNQYINCKSLEIKSDSLLRVQIDGEGFYSKDIKFEIVPNGIKFFAPKGLNFADYSHKAYKGGGK